MNASKLKRTQLLAYLSLVKGSQPGSSLDIAEIVAHQIRRPPTNDDHETIVFATDLAIEQGLVSGSAANLKEKRIYVNLTLTDRGQLRLHRLEHRFWWLRAAWDEVKDLAARIVAQLLKA